MFVLVCLLAACVSVRGQLVKIVPEVKFHVGSTAVLPCPDTSSHVTWIRASPSRDGTLVTPVRNGHVETTDTRFSARSDGSLVITHVQKFDESMYLCNGEGVYLRVTEDPSETVSKTQPEAEVTPRNDAVDPGPDHRGTRPPGDKDSDSPDTDWWKVPVGVLIGSSLVVLLIVVLRFWSKVKSERKSSVTEVIYHGIDDEEKQKRETEDPGVYYSTVSVNPTHEYSSVNKQRTKTREQCVYSVVQSSAHTGNIHVPADACRNHTES